MLVAPVEAEPEASDGADGAGGEPELIDDEGADAASVPLAEPASPASARPHPLEGWSRERIFDAAKHDPASLGPLSIGQPSAGALLNGMRAEASPLLELVDPDHAWGTPETLEYLNAAIRKVHARFPDTPPLALGHISARQGGPLRPHLSHQSGRDLDISFYYLDGTRWYARATEKNLDRDRTWAFVRALITETDVEMILIDHSVQAILRRFALDQNEDPAWIEGIFQGVPGKLRPIVRHAPGHATHLHVRFYNPIAVESARLAYDALVQQGVAPRLTGFVRHRARHGETLGKLAKKYGTTVQAIKAANGLRKSLIREHREYRIPVRAPARPQAHAPLTIPARRLPP